MIALLVACEYEPRVPKPLPPNPIDIPPDPFIGRFVSPSDLPRIDCEPGSLTGFAQTAYWPALAMRTAAPLSVHIAGEPSDVEVEHALSDDDLFARATVWNGREWRLRVIDACAAEADGTLRGVELDCVDGGPCEPIAFTADPLRRITGEADGDRLVVLGELAGDWSVGTTRTVRAHLDLVFLARGIDGVHIISVADPRAPVELAHDQDGTDVADVDLVRAVDGRRYLVVAGSPSSSVLDLADPTEPRRVALLASDAHAVTVDGSTAFFVEATGVVAFDLSDPRAPKRLGTHASPAPRGGFAAGGLVFLADAAVRVVDFRDARAPRELDATTPHAAHATHLTALDGHSIILSAASANLRLVDGDLASPSFLATLGTWSQRAEVPLHDLRAIDHRVYLAHTRDGIRVLDISNPHAPMLVGYFNTWNDGTGSAGPIDGAVGLDIDRAVNRIYVADTIRGLVILSDATP